MLTITKRALVASLLGSAMAPALARAAVGGSADAELLSFLDAAFDAQVALSPKTQLTAMQASFGRAQLSPAARLSYRLFEEQVATARRQFAFRDHSFPVSTNGSPAGDIPVLLINEHRVDSVADADAVLSSGALPLGVLEEQVEAWIAGVKAA